MPGGAWSTVAIIIAFVAVDVLVLVGLRGALGLSFRGWSERFPPVSPGEGSVTKRFQSFRFGLINAGLSVHVTVDERFLHMRPVLLMRGLGMPDVSVPWDEVHLVRVGHRLATVRIGSLTVHGPRWALELARDEAPLNRA